MADPSTTTMASDGASLHRCSKCGLIGDASNFYRDKNTATGRTCWCGACMRAAYAAYYARNRQKIVAKAVIYVRKRRSESEERREQERVWARELKRRKHLDPAAYAEHLRRGRDWCASNPDKVRKFKHMSKEQRCVRAARRYARKRHACPAWADHAAIAEVYEKCRQMNESGSVRYEVDHIIPILGKNVCGLHVEHNLQILPADKNKRKSNSFTW